MVFLDDTKSPALRLGHALKQAFHLLQVIELRSYDEPVFQVALWLVLKLRPVPTSTIRSTLLLFDRRRETLEKVSMAHGERRTRGMV